MKLTVPVVIVKPTVVHGQALFCALLLTAAQALAAQTIIQAGINSPNGLDGDGPTFFLNWTVPTNGVYLVQSSTNPADPAGWTTEDAVAAAIGPLKWMSPESLQQQKFYRLVTPQTQIFSAQPSVMPAGTGQTVLLAGQLFPPNATVLIDGSVATNVTVADSSDMLVTFSPTVPGTYEFELTVGGVVISSVTVTVYDPSAPPAYALQEPPEDPPGSPVTPSAGVPLAADCDINTGRVRFRVVSEAIGFDGFLVVGDKSRYSTATTPLSNWGHDPLTTPAYLNFAGAFAQDTDGNGGLDRLLESFNLTPPSSPGGSWTESIFSPPQGGSGGGSSPMATLLMPALMKAKEKANQVKCAADFTGRGTGNSVEHRRHARGKVISSTTPMSGTCVCLSSGEVQAQVTDMVVPGVGLDFIWTRTYRSRTGPDTALGPRWDFSYDIFCQTGGEGITVFDGGGRQDIYQPQSNGTFACQGCFRQGATNNNAFQLTFADGGYWAFLPFDASATAGKIARIVDRNGNTLSFQYNISGQLATIVDALDRTYTLSYSTGGQLETLTDYAGRTVTYEYYTGGTGGGTAGDLESVTSPAVTGTPNGNDFPSGKTTTYTYSTGYTADAENHLLLTVTDPLGQTAHVFSYDHSASDFKYLRCIQEQCGNPGQALTYYWEPQTPQPGQYAVIKCIVNDAVGNVSEYYYDSLNRPLRELDYTGRATPGVTVTDTANRPTNPVRSTDPAYFETDWQWNNDSLCTLETEPGGDSVQSVYQGDLNANTAARFRANMIIRRRRQPPKDTTDAALWPSGLQTYYQYAPGFGTEPAMVVCLDSHTRRVTPAGDDAVAASSMGQAGAGGNMTEDHEPNMQGNHKDSMMACGTAHEGHMIGNHKDCMMACGTAFGDGTGRINRVRMAYSVCFPISGTDPRHNQTTFTYDGNGNLTHLQQNGNTLGAGEDAVAPEDFTYNSAGQVTSHTLPDNGSGYRRVDQASYYASGQQQGYLESITVDAGGANETNSFQYDPYGNVIRCVDPLGNDTLYTVNALNEIVQEQSPLVSTTIAVRYTNQFAYDADDNLVSATAPGINGDGRPDNTVTGLMTWTYDVLNFVTSETNRIDSTHNAVTHYQYDANRNATNVILPEASNDHDSFNTVSCQYDERDLPFKIVRGAGSAAQSTGQLNVTLDGLISQAICGLEAGPETNRLFYDGFDRFIAMQDAMGNVATNSLDGNGNVVLQTMLGPTNQVTGVASVLLSQTTFTYDNLDRATRCSSAFFNLATGAPIGSGQSVASATYSDLGDPTSLTDPRGNVTRFAYDTVCRLSSVLDAGGNVVTCAYDNDDDVVLQTETDQSVSGGPSQVFAITNRYDNLDRLTADIDNVGNTEARTYNSRNDLTLYTDPRGNDTFFLYDGLDRCTACIRDLNGDGIPDLGDVETQTGYDADSRPVSFTDNNGNTTTQVYDSLDRVIRTQWADGSFSTNGYDPHDNVVMSVDQNGTVVSNAYDSLNRRTGTTVLAYGGGTAMTSTFEAFIYDGLSRLVQWADDAASCGAGYDSLGNCVNESLNGQSTSSTFDAMGNRLTLTYPGGSVVTYAYDSLDRETNVSSGGVVLETVVYSGPNRLAARQFGNGTSSLFSYDGVVGTANAPGDSGWGQISDAIVLPSTSGSGTPAISDWAFQYDPDGNKTGRNQTATFGGTGSTTGPQQQTFGYDPLNRLTNAGVFSGTTLKRLTQYALDGVGNRTNVGGYDETCGGAYTFNTENFLLNEYTTTGCDSRQYNANRDLTVLTSTGAGVSFTYDFRDQLVSTTNSGTETGATYAYDALCRRMHKTVYAPGLAAQVTSYFYDGGGVIEEQNGLGTEQAGYVLDDAGIVCMKRSGQTYYYNADDLGNVLDVTDAGGNVAERYDYDDYGQPQFLNASGNPENGPTGAATQSTVGNPYLFQSLQWEPESGLYHDSCGVEITDNLGKKRPPAGLAMIEITDNLGKKHSACYLDPRSGRTITASDKGGGNPLFGAGKDLFPSGNGFDFGNNNPWSAANGAALTVHCRGADSLNVFLQR